MLSMNRTTVVPAVPPLLLLLCGALAGPSPAQRQNAQSLSIEQLLTQMRAQEATARRIQLELHTTGAMPGGLQFQTDGVLRVLRSEQGDLIAVHSVVDYSFADDLRGRMESVRTPEGVWTLERSPTFGDVFLRLDAALVRDLEWAGQVLQRKDLPGLGDARAASPLGSAMVADLARRYQLEPLSRREHNGAAGTWYGGDRRRGLGIDDDPDLPLADRVEIFVRAPDQVLLEVVHLREGNVLQRISVRKIVIGEPMSLESFRIEVKGQRPIDAREHPPTWEQVQQILQQAKERAGGELPPSQRKQ